MQVIHCIGLEEAFVIDISLENWVPRTCKKRSSVFQLLAWAPDKVVIKLINSRESYSKSVFSLSACLLSS